MNALAAPFEEGIAVPSEARDAHRLAENETTPVRMDGSGRAQGRPPAAA
ncbi:MAG: hypothetical protein JF886_02755 [Candidatus Dormibacteraeota bacterium]|uniref:Uncharacterized protein n=1 Tax=Candidatus Aeolococcus gillhamiae TaxID=3127015 RepID=A0A934JV87_9BACT|nr:hypothetical protein [Candidatus Dormibacteraeota bacterium]